MKDKRVVKIKTWDQMEKEFGLYNNEYINCDYVFTRAIEKTLPKNRIIVLEGDNNDKYIIKAFDIHFYISEDIIEEEYNREDYPQYFI
jgi:hypothetical protein